MDISKYLEDNIHSLIIQSEVPEVCKNEVCCLGIDEAGRGPVLGNNFRFDFFLQNIDLEVFQVFLVLLSVLLYCKIWIHYIIICQMDSFNQIRSLSVWKSFYYFWPWVYLTWSYVITLVSPWSIRWPVHWSVRLYIFQRGFISFCEILHEVRGQFNKRLA